MLLLVLLWQLIFTQGDPGLEYIREAGFVETPGWQVTDSGYTVTIAEAYADANRIIFTVEAAVPPDLTYDRVHVAATFDYTLDDETRSRLAFLTIQEFPPEDRPRVHPIQVHYRTPSDIDVVDFTLNVRVLVDREEVAAVTFDESLPVRGAIVYEPADETVLAGGIPLTLRRAVVTRSATFAELCYPGAERLYAAGDGTAETPFGPADFDELGSQSAPDEDGNVLPQYCILMQTFTAYDTGEISLRLDSLETLGGNRTVIDGPWAWTFTAREAELSPTATATETP